MIKAENMIRVGIVSAVNASTKQARVIFPESNNLVSDWLYVLQRTDETTTHVDGHIHKITGWMPKVRERVLCVMMCGDETDGYVLGAIP